MRSDAFRGALIVDQAEIFMRLSEQSFAGLFLLALLLVSQVLHADSDGTCQGRDVAIVHSAYPEAKSSNGSFVMDDVEINLSTAKWSSGIRMTCRTWPARPNLTLVAVPLNRHDVFTNNRSDVELILLDTASLKVQSRLRLVDRIDSIYIYSMAFDTAPYWLTPNQLAFGFRLTKRDSSQAMEPFKEVDLFLYVVEHGRIRSVLDGIATTGQWDNCAGTMDRADSTLAMDSATHHGYSDILVSKRPSSDTWAIGKSGQCERKLAADSKESYRLIYDGNQYVVPMTLRPSK